jgi:hypothetical protein
MDCSGVERNDSAGVSSHRVVRLEEPGAVGIKFWKDLGLGVRDGSDQLLRIDGEQLARIFENTGDLGIAVMVHTPIPIRPSFQ